MLYTVYLHHISSLVIETSRKHYGEKYYEIDCVLTVTVRDDYIPRGTG